MITILNKFKTNPARSIDFKGIKPLEYAIAFGGVPIGNIPAQLAARVIGIPSIMGGICNAIAKDAKMGAITMT